MGWKGTKTITRDRALELITSRLFDCSNDELSNALESLGFGENFDLPHYGHNFTVVDELDNF